jgi:cytochrome c556
METTMKKALVTMLLLVPLVASSADTNTEAIAARQAAFKLMKESMAAVKDAMTAEDYSAAGESASTVLDNARALTKLFPAGSYQGDTRAKEKIWENLEDFTQRQQQLIADTELLVNASASKDAKQLKAAFKQTAQNCKGCHMKYRQIM